MAAMQTHTWIWAVCVWFLSGFGIILTPFEQIISLFWGVLFDGVDHLTSWNEVKDLPRGVIGGEIPEGLKDKIGWLHLWPGALISLLSGTILCLDPIRFLVAQLIIIFFDIVLVAINWIAPVDKPDLSLFCSGYFRWWISPLFWLIHWVVDRGQKSTAEFPRKSFFYPFIKKEYINGIYSNKSKTEVIISSFLFVWIVICYLILIF